MNHQPPPKVFISHASEDKEKFVLGFAEKLRSKGVDAWLDQWEMKPGDKLVGRIFEEGIKKASAVIIVLSATSVAKAWVREELDAAAVKRINAGTKLIPVVIEDCEIPEVLNSTLWERVSDLENYQASLDRILAAIFDLDTRPQLGSPPPYANRAISSIGALNTIDSIVMRESCEKQIESGDVYLDPVTVFDLDSAPKLPVQELKDSLEILDNNGYIDIMKALGQGFRPYRVTKSGFEIYARSAIEDYESLTGEMMSLIVNRDIRSNIELAQALNRPQYLANHIIWVLEQHGYVKCSRTIGELIRIYDVSAALRREVRTRST